MITKSTLFALAVVLASLPFASTAVRAASGGGSSSSGASTPSCKSGYIWNAKTHQCERKSASTMDDKSLYTEGRDLALAGRYQESLATLGAIKIPDSMALTMIGYSWRKQGDYHRAQAYYDKALALDPNNVNTHEYLGEAYAEQGKIDLAKIELAKVEAISGSASEQYQDLSRAIAGIPDQS